MHFEVVRDIIDEGIKCLINPTAGEGAEFILITPSMIIDVQWLYPEQVT